MPAALAYWLGNPLLNPAVLVFLFLATPWQWGVTRLVVGALVVVGVSALVGTRLSGRTVDADVVLLDDEPLDRRSPLTGYLRSLLRLTVVLVPEYAVVVLVVGGLSGWASQFEGFTNRLGVVGLVVAAAVGAMLVLPTGGEIPVLLGLTRLGASTGLVGVLLIALPAVSLPSLVMVGRSLSVRVATLSVGVIGAGLVAASVLAVLS